MGVRRSFLAFASCLTMFRHQAKAHLCWPKQKRRKAA